MAYDRYDQNKLNDILDLVVQCNNSESHKVGFAGSKVDEIRDTILHDFSDLPLEESIFVYQEKDVFSFFGFDIDKEDLSVEVWGPFLKDNMNMDDICSLWSFAMDSLKHLELTYDFFIESHNGLARKFLENYLKATKIMQHTDYVLNLGNISYSEKVLATETVEIERVSTLSKDNFASSVALHNQYFPGTYYRVENILERINDDNNLYIMTKHSDFIGYAYIEKSKLSSNVTLEYISIDEKFQGNGYAKQLLRKVISEIDQEQFNTIKLCVDDENQPAKSLYKSLGFEVSDSYIHYQKK